MVLSTHAVIGAAAASMVPEHPILGFTLAIVSHFLADTIPHWHYRLNSLSHDDAHPMDTDMDVRSRFFFTDFLKISFDASFGTLLALLFFAHRDPHLAFIVLLGAFGGMLPDALQFLYWKWRHEPLVSLQRFHIWIHANFDLDHLPLWGPTAQALIICICIVLVRELG